MEKLKKIEPEVVELVDFKCILYLFFVVELVDFLCLFLFCNRLVYNVAVGVTRLTPECRTCRHREFCRSCRLKNRDEQNRSRLCEGWQLFYDHTIPRFRLLADRVRRGDFARKK